uniref:Integrase core domain containing protein n=1 Tax=Solanum tuberosum TaxID=4113 RepID=M1DFU0_SOLTU
MSRLTDRPTVRRSDHGLWNANTVPLVPDQGVSNAEFQNTTQPFAQSMNNQNNQQVEGDKFGEIAKVTKKARTGNYEYSQQKSGGGNHSQFRQDQNSRAPGSKSQGSVSGNRTYPTCPKCEKLERKRRREVKNPSSRTQQGSISSSPEIERFLRGIRHQNANTVPLVPDQGVWNAELQNTIQPFAQSMNNQNIQQVEGDKLREIAKVTMKARIGWWKSLTVSTRSE